MVHIFLLLKIQCFENYFYMTVWFFLVLLLKYCNSCTNGESNVYLEIWTDILSRPSAFSVWRVWWSLCFWHSLLSHAKLYHSVPLLAYPPLIQMNKIYILKIIILICTCEPMGHSMPMEGRRQFLGLCPLFPLVHGLHDWTHIVRTHKQTHCLAKPSS